jgi:serine protease inhibitor
MYLNFIDCSFSEDMRDPHLVIANGNFFKGKWLLPFNSSNTIREKFYDDKGIELGEVEMMHQNSHFRYSRISELGAKVVELPYEVCFCHFCCYGK